MLETMIGVTIWVALGALLAVAVWRASAIGAEPAEMAPRPPGQPRG